MRSSKLEDYGISRSVPPKERKAEYIRQCKELPQNQQAKFWLKCIENDPEIAPIVIFKRAKR